MVTIIIITVIIMLNTELFMVVSHFTLLTTGEAGTAVVLILHMWKLSLREYKSLSQGH